jgi:hypothetical protein
MIYETLQILKEQLEEYLNNAGFGKNVVLDNIALWDPSGQGNTSKIDKKVVITLLKTEEEATMKNFKSYTIINDKTEYKNPPVNLNLYILISSNYDDYDNSLRSISKVIQFFQGKKVFTSVNTAYNRTNVSFENPEAFKFILDLYSLSFEELNYVWGTLGGKQLPAVIYRIQLIKIEEDKLLSASRVINQVEGELKDSR